MSELILEEIKTILSENSDLKPKIPIAQIVQSTRFREDLGFDSLAMAALFYSLQDIYPTLDEEQATKWKTVADSVSAVRAVKAQS